jgi:hypothetical protein
MDRSTNCMRPQRRGAKSLHRVRCWQHRSIVSAQPADGSARIGDDATLILPSLVSRTRRRGRRPRRPDPARVYWLCSLFWTNAGFVRNWMAGYPIAASLLLVPMLYCWRGIVRGGWLPLPVRATALLLGTWCTVLAVIALVGWR